MPAWSEGHKPLEGLSEGSSPTSCVEAALSAPRKNTMSMRRESSEAALRKSASWQQVYPPPDDMWVVRQASRKPAVMKRLYAVSFWPALKSPAMITGRSLCAGPLINSLVCALRTEDENTSRWVLMNRKR